MHRPRVLLDRKLKLMKGKALRKHSLHEKTAASVLYQEVLTEVFARYRCRSKTILYLVELCDDVRLRTNRSFAVPILLAVLTYLSFAATGAIQLMVGDTLALSQPTISRPCKQVGEVISGLAGRLFNFPRVKRQPS